MHKIRSEAIMLTVRKEGPSIKGLFLFCVILIMTGFLLFAGGCDKTQQQDRTDKPPSSPAPEKPDFNPEEPAPVPKGTPDY